MRRRFLALFTVVAGLAVLFAPRASAADLPDPFGCQPTAPAPHRPNDGIAGMVAPKPDPLPPAEFPFGSEAKTTPYDQYGGAGLWWPTYDLGCAGGTTTGAMANVWTDIGNWGMSGANFVIATTAALRHIAWDDGWIRPVDDGVRQSTGRMAPWFSTAMGIGLLGAGLLIVVRARKADYGQTAHTVGWALLALTIGTLAIGYPTVAGQTYDEVTIGGTRTIADTVSSTTGAANAAPADHDGAVGAVSDDAVYSLWARGMFGDDHSSTAQKYGPLLYDSIAYTWREAETLDRDPDAGKAITERKAQQFKDVAAKIQEDDPAAYKRLQGVDSATDRAMYGALAVFVACVMCLFLAIAGGLVFVARLVGRVVVMAAPVIAPFAAVDRFRSAMHKLFNIIAVAITNLLIFTVAGGVMSAVAAGMLASRLPLLLSTMIVGFGGMIAWHATKPMRSLAYMAGMGGAYAAGRGAFRTAGRYMMTERAVQHGTEDALAHDRHIQAEAAAAAAGAGAAAGAAYQAPHDEAPPGPEWDVHATERAPEAATWSPHPSAPQPVSTPTGTIGAPGPVIDVQEVAPVPGPGPSERGAAGGVPPTTPRPPSAPTRDPWSNERDVDGVEWTRQDVPVMALPAAPPPPSARAE